jgi:hypothetical protein
MMAALWMSGLERNDLLVFDGILLQAIWIPGENFHQGSGWVLASSTE